MADDPASQSEGASALAYNTGRKFTADQIRRIQRIVGVAADGVWAPATVAAVRGWQAAHGLTADGKVGPRTSTALTAHAPHAWTVLVFAGPGAFAGLSVDATLVDDAAGLAAIAERLALGPDVALVVQQIAEPRLLELLTATWRARRLTGAADGLHVGATDEPRDLAAFVRSACAAHPARRYALVLLGDVLRASEDRLADVWNFPDERLGRPITVSSGTAETREKRPTTVSSGTSETREKRPTTVSSGTSETRDKRPADGVGARTVPRWSWTAEDLARPKLPQRGTWRPEPIARVQRRIELVAHALAAVDRARRADVPKDRPDDAPLLGLLVADTCDLADIELVERLAPFAEVIVTSQIEAPRAAGPLVDLLAALSADPTGEPAALAREMVVAHDAVMHALTSRCRAVVERAEPDEHDDRLDLARRVVLAGASAAAVQSAALPALTHALRGLAVDLAGLIAEDQAKADDQGLRALRRCVADADARYDPRLQRCDLVDLVDRLLDPASSLPPRWRSRLGPRARELRERVQADDLVLVARHLRAGGGLHGLSLTLPLVHDELVSPFARPELDDDPWARVMRALHALDPVAGDERLQAQAGAARRMYADIAAFYREPPALAVPASSTTPAPRAWSMLHYLAADAGAARSDEDVARKLAAERRLAATLARRDLRHVDLAYQLDLRPPGPSQLCLHFSATGFREGQPIEDRNVYYNVWNGEGDAFVFGRDEHFFLTPTGDILDTSSSPPTLRFSLRARIGDPDLRISQASWNTLRDLLTLEWRCEPEPVGCRADREGRVEHSADSGDPATLAEFVVWGLRGAPARHVGLVISDLDGWEPNFELCRDHTARTAMTVSQLARTLEQVLRQSGRDALDVLILDTARLSFLEVAHELRSVARVLVVFDARHEQAGDYGRYGDYGHDALFDALERAFDPAGDDLAARALADVLPTEADDDRGYAELERAWRVALARRVARLVIAGNPNPDRMLALDLTRIDAPVRHLDSLCRMLFAGLARAPIWQIVRGTLMDDDRVAWMDWLATMPLSDFLAKMRVELATAAESPAGAAEAPRLVAALDRLERSLAELTVAGAGRLMIYCKPGATGPASGGYAALDFNRRAHLHALRGAVKLVGDVSHPLWDLVLAGLARASPTRRQELLTPLLGATDRDFMLRPLASLTDRPAITLSLESDGAPADERYLLRLSSSESTALLLQQDSRVDPASIDRAIAGLELLLARGDATATAWSYLEALGASLGEDIISRLHDRLEAERIKLIADSVDDDAHLALQIPRALMRYPWELMSVPVDLERSSAKQMLCERFAVGRQVWSDGGRAGLSRRHAAGPLKVLILGDPQLHGGGAQLPGARDEARAIAETFAALAAELGPELDFDPARDVFIHRTVTAESLRQLLRRGHYDIVHFSGHARFDSDRAERSAWLLSDGPLAASELRATLAWCPRPPWLIYANACEAGMSGAPTPRYRGEVFGLADACIREGVSSYIAPLWPVGDEAARVLATTLYRSLLLDRATLGAALLQARRTTRALCESQRRGGGTADISWASVVLYGDPTDRLFDALRG